MTPDEIRAEFERWAKRHGFGLSRAEDGRYSDHDSDVTFNAYSAAHAAAERRYGRLVGAAGRYIKARREYDGHEFGTNKQLMEVDISTAQLDATLAALKGEK